jgi:hypothetical protein
MNWIEKLTHDTLHVSDLKTYKVVKPVGTFYSDYFVYPNGYVTAIFEHGNLVTNKKVCKTKRFTAYQIRETSKHYYITI